MNKLISKLLSVLIVFSIFFDVLPISVYANEANDLKMQGIEGYRLDLQKLNLSIIDNDTDKNRIEVEIKTDKIAEDGIILIFQKGINFSEKNKENLPKNLYLDSSYEDKGNYGENYTSIKIKQDSKNSIFIDNEKNNEDKFNELKSEELLEKDKKMNLTFDIASNLQKGNLIAAINNEYAIVVDTPGKFLERNNEISKVEEEKVEEEKVEVLNLKKEKNEKNDISFDYGYVTFMVQNKQGQLIKKRISFELKKETTPGSGKYTTVKTQYSDQTSGELKLVGLDLNTNYQLFVKGLGEAVLNYEKPTESVAKFYFDQSGIHFQEGSTAIFLYPRDGASHIQFGIRGTENNSLNGITTQLNKEVSPGKEEKVVSAISKNYYGKKAIVQFNGLNLGVKYRVYVTNLGGYSRDYEMSTEPVAEFYFDEDTGEVKFIKGYEIIRIYKKGEDKISLKENQYFVYADNDGNIKISKETGEDETNAFCFQKNNTFPKYGDQILYEEIVLTPKSLYELAHNPRIKNPKELYDRIRQVIAFTVINKDKLMNEYNLDYQNFYGRGFYITQQEAIWYFSDSLVPGSSANGNQTVERILNRAVNYILEESKKISEEDMNKVKLKCYTALTKSSRKPYQALLAYNFDETIIEKFNIQIKKIDNKGNTITSEATFSLFKQLPDGEKGEAIKENVPTKNGIIEFLDLEKGEYLLYETKEPEGYEKPTEPYHIKIDGYGKITATYKGKEVQVIENENTIPIVNEAKSFVLPDTGGMGIKNIMIAGMSFIFIFILFLFKKQKITRMIRIK